MSAEWSFALINDTHIGCFYPAYGDAGYGDGATGEDYFLTARLRESVAWLNDHMDGPDRIRFVALNGDITDSAEECEFIKAREILDGLKMPCVPLFGNHDAWPYAGSRRAGGPTGSEVFNRVFRGTFAALEASGVVTGWSKDSSTIAGTLLNNYSFDVGGVHFLALDLVSREAAPNGRGCNGRGIFHAPTESWLREHLELWGDAGPVVLISHHPLTNAMLRPRQMGAFEWAFVRPLLAAGMPTDADCQAIAACLEGHAEVLAAFAGHSHSAELLLGHLPTPPFIWDFNDIRFQPIGKAEVKIGEATVAGSNGPAGQDKGNIRIVKVSPDGRLDYGRVVGPASPGANYALNPSFDANILDGVALFIPHRFSKQDAEYVFDYGDGTDSGGFKPFSAGWWDRTNLLDSEVHEYTDGLDRHLVILRVREETPTGAYYAEEISRYVIET